MAPIVMVSVSLYGSGMKEDKLLLPSEVAIAFGVSVKTITRWRRAGKLNPVRTLGGHNRYRAYDIERLLDRERVHPEDGRDGYRIRLLGKAWWDVDE